MPDKQTTVTVNHSHRVHLDPEHGVTVPRAEDLADKGVVTASAVTVSASEQVKAPEGEAEALRAAGVAHKS